MTTVLMVNFSDRKGGAARAAHRLLLGVRQLGVDARMYVAGKTTDESYIIGPSTAFQKASAVALPVLDTLPLRFYPGALPSTWSLGWLPSVFNHGLTTLEHQLLHLHWIGSGFIGLSQFVPRHRPIVWTMHDMWPFTGGCHYANGCTNYRNSCGRCPQIGSRSRMDVSWLTWSMKRSRYSRLNAVFVAPSRWLSDCARESSLLAGAPIEVIPYGIDTALYRPIDKQNARDHLSLPQGRRLVLAGADNISGDRRKGLSSVVDALRRVPGGSDSVDLVIFGASHAPSEGSLPFRVHYLGTLHDELSLVLAYSAADLFVTTPIQDNLPNTVMEAMACGCPVVSWRVGGIPDMVDHLEDGYLAAYKDATGISRGIGWCLENPGRTRQLGRRAREVVEQRFSSGAIAHRYVQLYERLLGSQH